MLDLYIITVQLWLFPNAQRASIICDHRQRTNKTEGLLKITGLAGAMHNNAGMLKVSSLINILQYHCSHSTANIHSFVRYYLLQLRIHQNHQPKIFLRTTGSKWHHTNIFSTTHFHKLPESSSKSFKKSHSYSQLQKYAASQPLQKYLSSLSWNPLLYIYIL